LQFQVLLFGDRAGEPIIYTANMGAYFKQKSENRHVFPKFRQTEDFAGRTKRIAKED
jgi:hypothetical protein